MDDDSSSSASEVRRLQTRLLLFLLGLTLAVFAAVSGHEFVNYDDGANIYANPHVQSLGWEQIRWMFTDTTYARRYMPLGWLSYAIDYQLFGLTPSAFHIGNLVLHLANAALLFFLLKRLVELASPSAKDGAARAAPVWCAAVGALFWAVHPLRVEPVAWASGRIYCLVFFCTALWLLAWLQAQNPALARRQRKLLYGLSVFFYLVSLLVYPLALFAPAVLLVLEVYPLRRVGVKISDWWKPASLRLWCYHLPFLAVGAGMIVASLGARVVTDASYRPTTLEDFSFLSRVMQAFYIWAYYAWKPWAPYDLSPSYTTLHAFNPLGWVFLASAALVIVLTAGLLALRRRWPGALALWLCHLALLVPVLGLTEYPHAAADRYSYLHGILWSVGIAGGLRVLWVRQRQACLAGAAVTAASLLFALLAWQQVTVWSDSITLFRSVIAGQSDQPHRARFDELLARCYLRCGLTNEGAASFQNAIYYESRRADRHLYDQGVLARCHVTLGDIFSNQGRLEEGLSHYQAALQADPNSTPALMKIGVALGALHRDTEALKCFEAVLRRDAGHVQAHQNLALLLRQLGREEEALRHVREKQRLTATQ